MRNNCVQLTDTNISFRFADKSRESRWNILENAKAFCATHHRLLRTRQNVICPRAWTSFVQVSTKFWASFVSWFHYSVFNAHLINVKVCIVDLDNECLIYAVSRKSEAFFVFYSLLLWENGDRLRWMSSKQDYRDVCTSVKNMVNRKQTRKMCSVDWYEYLLSLRR